MSHEYDEFENEEIDHMTPRRKVAEAHVKAKREGAKFTEAKLAEELWTRL